MAKQEEVALHINVSVRTFRELAKLAGSPSPCGRAGYDVEAWRYFYIDFLKKKNQLISAEEPASDEGNGQENDEDRDILPLLGLNSARFRQ